MSVYRLYFDDAFIISMSSIDNDSSNDDDACDVKDLKLKVLNFQSHEESFKHYRQQINHALTYPNEYQKSTFEILLSHEEIELSKLNKVFNSLNTTNRRPYVKIIQQYQSSVKEHQQLIGVLDDEDVFLQKIKQSTQINMQLLEQYKETLTWQYLLRGIMALSGAFIVHTIIGASSRWNFLNAYATSYYKVTENPYLVVTQDSYASPVSLFCMGLGMRAGIRLQKSIGTFYTTLAATFIGSIFTYLSSFMPNFQLYVLFSFALFPFCSSLAFHSVINLCYNYYPKHRLLINAVIIIGTGFGHLFFGLLDTQCINPEDVPSINGYFGGELDYICREVPWCMKKTAFLIAILGGLASALLYPAIRFNESKIIQKKHNRTRLDFEYACASERQALGSKIFWIFVLIIVSTTSGSYFLNSNFKNLESKYELNTLRLAQVLMAFNFSNSFSRALWAVVFTKIGFKNCMIIITSLNIFVLGTMSLILRNEQIYMIYYIIGGMCLGGCMVCNLNFATLVFGEFVGEQLPGYVWTGYSLANLFQYFMVNAYDVVGEGYTPVLLILAFLNLVSLFMVLRTKLQGDWENSLNYLELKCYFK